MTTSTTERPTTADTAPTRAERIEARARRARRRRRIAWSFTGLITLTVAAAIYLVWFTGVLGLTAVTVAGAEGAVADKVAAAAPSPDGTPLIRIDLEQVRAAVLEVPEVAGATVSRSWPSSLVVTVTQRQPVAVVSANGKLWLLDRTGSPYATTDKAAAQKAGLPTLRLATPGAGDPATLAGIAVSADLPPELATKVASVSARSPYDVSLELTDGRTVQWGDPTDGARKAQALTGLLGQEGSHFDVSDPELVTVKK